MSQLLDTKAVARRLGLQVSTIRKMRYQGRLPYVKLGRAIRFKEEDIEGVIAKGYRPMSKEVKGLQSFRQG